MKLLKLLLALSLAFLIAYSIYGISVVTASDATVEQVDTNTMECYNYSMLKDQMFELQSKWIYSKGLKRKVIERKINNLYPSYMNRQSLCLWYTVEPN